MNAAMVGRTIAALVVAGALAGAAFAAPPAPSGPVNVLVLVEHGVGGSALAQNYLDKFIALAAQQYGWPAAHGQYFTSRAGAEAYVKSDKPRYGILSLAAFLAFRKKYDLEVIGNVAVTRAGGQQYFLISKSAVDFAGCRGQTMATDHADDPRFIEHVVAKGAFVLGDFKLDETQRPLQAIKKVLGDEAVCALVDDQQMAELPHIQGAEGIRSVWESAKLPPMTVVAFGTTPPADRKKFKDGLARLCDGEGRSVCAEVGIVTMTAADVSAYNGVIAAYGK